MVVLPFRIGYPRQPFATMRMSSGKGKKNVITAANSLSLKQGRLQLSDGFEVLPCVQTPPALLATKHLDE